MGWFAWLRIGCLVACMAIAVVVLTRAIRLTWPALIASFAARPARSAAPARLGALGIALIGILIYLGIARPGWLQFGLLGATIGAIDVLAVATIRRHPGGRGTMIWVLAVSLVGMLASLALWSPGQADANRYIMEGRQILAGQNPYAIPPEAAEARALVPAEVAGEVNHPSWTAIYPPIALLYHAAVAAIAPEPFLFCLSAIAGMILLFALTLHLLKEMRLEPAHLVAIAWHPVLFIFIIGGAHQDMLMAVLLVGALAAAASGKISGSVLGGAAAILVKPFAVVCLPLLLHRIPKRYWILPPAVVLAVYVPWIDAGDGVVRSLLRFGEGHYHAVIAPVIRYAVRPLSAGGAEPTLVTLILCGVLILGLYVAWRRSRSDLIARRAMRLLAVLMLCLPVLHPWYLFTLVALLPFSRGWGLLAWTAASPLAMLHGLGIRDGVWNEQWWVTMISHAPTLPLVLHEIFAQLPMHGVRSPEPSTACDVTPYGPHASKAG
ncbi:MAG: hypothetical protein H0X45_00120 [Planctomycetes bacterium]|nr:hypothetical protein [Nannocystis sp.]MBA3547003.1 hypothetical protein [Nannocystis sp.]MBA3845024.1 hypothetical protein [Planctomycetota bacterium]